MVVLKLASGDALTSPDLAEVPIRWLRTPDDRGLLFALVVKSIEYRSKLLSFGGAWIDLLQPFYDL